LGCSPRSCLVVAKISAKIPVAVEIEAQSIEVNSPAARFWHKGHREIHPRAAARPRGLHTNKRHSPEA
jgi:hypothetical protein